MKEPKPPELPINSGYPTQKVLDEFHDKQITMEYSKMTTEEFATELCEVIRDGGASISDVMYKLEEWKKELQHHKDTTVGLWCTDRPDLIIDEKKIMFQLT